MAALRPFSPATFAAMAPPGPAPTISTSYNSVIVITAYVLVLLCLSHLMGCPKGADLGTDETFHADVLIYYHFIVNYINGCHRTVVYTATAPRALFFVDLNQ
jgi:hypothetical protein